MQDNGQSKLRHLEDALAVARLEAEIAANRQEADIVRLRTLTAALETEVHRLHAQTQTQQAHLDRMNRWRDHELRRQIGPAGLELNDGFDGQVSKAEMFQELVAKGPMRVALHTGVFLGRTTRYLAGRFHHVVAFEDTINDLEQAQQHCAIQPNISFGYGDSRELQANWANIPIPLDEIDFAYLDARASGICSVREELAFVLSAMPNAVIFIDDIKVEDDIDYSYATFPPIAQDFAYVEDVLKAHDPLCFYPVRRGLDDTSLHYGQHAPSGALVVVPRMLADVVKGAKTIRPVG
jgi:hypothetical protein